MSTSPLLRPKYILNERGKPTEVILSVRAYRRLLEIAEDAADARALDEAVKNAKGFHRLDDVLAEMEQEGLL